MSAVLKPQSQPNRDLAGAALPQPRPYIRPAAPVARPADRPAEARTAGSE